MECDDRDYTLAAGMSRECLHSGITGKAFNRKGRQGKAAKSAKRAGLLFLASFAALLRELCG
jgi:hypothetical protein